METYSRPDWPVGPSLLTLGQTKHTLMQSRPVGGSSPLLCDPETLLSCPEAESPSTIVEIGTGVF